MVDNGGWEGTRLTRKRLLQTAAAGAAGVAAAQLAPAALGARARAARAVTGGTLNLYTWANYFAPENLAAFKKSTGIHVNIATYPSNDVAFAKVNASGGGGFDIVIPTSDWVPLMAKRNLLQPLDKSRIPWQYVDKSIIGKSFDPKNEYSVPKDYGTIGVIYDPTQVSKPIKTWGDFLTVGSEAPASGKIQMTDAPDEVLGIPLWSWGKSWNTTDTTLLKKASTRMQEFSQHVKVFNGWDVDGTAKGTYSMSVVTQGLARFALLENPKLKFVIPAPHSELWIDNYCILASGKNQDAAYSFIDFMLQPARQVKDCGYIGFPTVLPGLESKLPASVKLRSTIFIPPAKFKTLIPHVIDESVQGLVESEYQKITAATH